MEGIHFKEVLTYASCDFIIQVQVFFDCKNVEGGYAWNQKGNHRTSL